MKQGRIDVWRISCAPGADESEELLDDGERERAARFAREQGRRRFVVSHAQTRSILARYTGDDPSQLRFDRRCLHCGHPTHGKPRIADTSEHVCFSLSHTGDLALLAVAAGREVGIDVEAAGRDVDHDGIVAAYFSAPERARLEALPEERRAKAFIRWWSRKEAVSKAVGLGLALPLDGVDTSWSGPSMTVDVQSHGRFAVADVDPAEGYVAAVAAQGAGDAEVAIVDA